MEEVEQLTKLGGEAFKYAIENAYEVPNFILFVMTEDEHGKGEIHRFAAPSNSISLTMAHAFLAKERPRFAVIAYKGFITDGGEKVNAIFLDCYDREQGCGVEMGRGFQPKTKDTEMSFIGEMKVFAEDVPYPTPQ